ncbi:radical SAM protein [Micromonospora aurantiaca]|nr:radical SAM protein [Micromonospora aurantiaca]
MATGHCRPTCWTSCAEPQSALTARCASPRRRGWSPRRRPYGPRRCGPASVLSTSGTGRTFSAFPPSRPCRTKSTGRRLSSSSQGSSVATDSRESGTREPGPPFAYPSSIDINPTARCNLRCTFCWGPDHDIRDGLDTAEWKDLLSRFRAGGTSAVVFTGGEPLLRRDIGGLLRHASEEGFRVTLSTNGIRLGRHQDLLRYVDEIGIPIDGSNVAVNAKMRQGKLADLAFDAALSALDTVRRAAPAVQITVRTVVSAVNADDIPNIAYLLSDRRPVWDRWKLYQFVAAGIGLDSSDEHQVDNATFRRALAEARTIIGPGHMVGQEQTDRVGRYLFVGPRGELFGVSDSVGYRTIGYWRDVLENASNVPVDLSRNGLHGQISQLEGPDGVQ